jgi:hypothetical protein
MTVSKVGQFWRGLFMMACYVASTTTIAAWNVPHHVSHRRTRTIRVRSTKWQLSGLATIASSSSTAAEEGRSLAKTYTFFSPCKINLFLRILRKREDGYHDLASLFQAVGFGDTLEMTPVSETSTAVTTADTFTCNMEGVPTDSSNLVLRAVQLMRDKTGVQRFFDLNLIKQCPAQAGLGGGSANAATAMWGANELMGRPATLPQVRANTRNGDNCQLRREYDAIPEAFTLLLGRLFSLADGGMVQRIGK